MGGTDVPLLNKASKIDNNTKYLYKNALDGSEVADSISEKIQKIQTAVGYVTSGITSLPGGTTVSSVTSGSGSFGSYVQVDSGLSNDTIVTGYSIFSNFNDDETKKYELIIGTGSGGSESEVASVTSFLHDYDDPDERRAEHDFYFTKPLYITSGTRVAIKIADNDSSNNEYKVTLHVVEL